MIFLNITFNFHKAPSIPKTGALAPDIGIIEFFQFNLIAFVSNPI